MNLNNFTLKAQESIQKAQEIAVGSQHPQIENAHILKGLLISDDNVVPFLIKKLDVNLTHLQSELDKLLNGYVKVSGGQIYLSPNATTALQKSLTFLKDFNDEFVTVEHILLGILSAWGTGVCRFMVSMVMESHNSPARAVPGLKTTPIFSAMATNAIATYMTNLAILFWLAFSMGRSPFGDVSRRHNRHVSKSWFVYFQTFVGK